MKEALVDYNMHFKLFDSFGAMIQPECKMNNDAYMKVKRNSVRVNFWIS